MNNKVLTDKDVSELEVGTQVKLVGEDWPTKLKGTVVRVVVRGPNALGRYFSYRDLTYSLYPMDWSEVEDYSVRLANNRDIGFEGTEFEVGDVVELSGKYWWEPALGLFREVTECPCGMGCGEVLVYVPHEFSPGDPEYLEDLDTGYEATLVTPASLATTDALGRFTELVTAEDPKDYYQGTDVLDFIERHELGFPLGNAVKYISRAGKKPGQELVKDLTKAIDYIQFVIDKENSNDH